MHWNGGDGCGGVSRLSGRDGCSCAVKGCGEEDRPSDEKFSSLRVKRGQPTVYPSNTTFLSLCFLPCNISSLLYYVQSPKFDTFNPLFCLSMVKFNNFR